MLLSKPINLPLLLLLLVLIHQLTINNALTTPSSKKSIPPKPDSNRQNKRVVSGNSVNKPPTRRSSSFAAKTTDRNKRWYTNRANSSQSTSTSSKKRKRRPPRWEVEGDALFLLVKDKEEGKQNEQSKNTAQTARDILFKAFNDVPVSTKQQIDNPTKKTQNDLQKSFKGPPHLMWGNCSVGPVLKSKLALQSYQNPTPIQEASFSIITNPKRPNAVIASPTGSGKTLAYLVPILSILKRKVTTIRRSASDTSGSGGANVLIVTPTIELAYQIQGVVDQLWPREDDNDNSAMCVIGNQQWSDDDDNNDNEDDTTNSMSTELQYELLLEQMNRCTILSGTARSINTILSYSLKKNSSKAIFSNLQIVVLDEADRLLQTERMARILEERKIRNSNDQEQQSPPSWLLTQKYKKTPTEVLLSTLSKKLNYSFDVNTLFNNKNNGKNKNLQLICASATVGRTLRRQIMELTNAPSIEKGSTLVCGDNDERVGKQKELRKSSIVPSSIHHWFTFLDIDNIDKQQKDIQEMDAIWNILLELPPAPCLIFPGKLNGGVAALYDYLSSTKNCNCVHSFLLQNNDDKEGDESNSRTSPLSTVSSSANNNNMVKKYESWEETPIYTVKERFARGLDIPNIDYVILCTPPTSAAAYTHLSGRTGRIGKFGVAITLVRDEKEAKRVVSFANTLGVEFSSLEKEKEVLVKRRDNKN